MKRRSQPGYALLAVFLWAHFAAGCGERAAFKTEPAGASSPEGGVAMQAPASRRAAGAAVQGDAAPPSRRSSPATAATLPTPTAT